MPLPGLRIREGGVDSKKRRHAPNPHAASHKPIHPSRSEVLRFDTGRYSFSTGKVIDAPNQPITVTIADSESTSRM